MTAMNKTVNDLRNRARRRRIAVRVFHYAALVAVSIITLFPLLWSFFASMRSDRELYMYAMPFTWHTIFPVEYNFESYVTVLTVYGFPKAVLNTLLVIGVQIPLACAVNSVAAFAFSTFDFKGKKLLFGFFVISFMLPGEAITMPLYQMMTRWHWVNTRWAMIIPGVASGLQLFLFRQFFADVPASLVESARVDGANWPTIFLKIMVPMCVPIFITAGLMIFMGEWNSYLWPLLVARDKEIRTVQIMLSVCREEHITAWSAMYAGAVLSIMIPIALFLPLQKYYVEGITSGAVKG